MDTRSQLTSAMRARLLDATAEVLGDVGPDALTMQAVAERADVALRTLYNHFGSREQLLADAFTRMVEETKQTVDELVPASGTVAERLRGFVDAYCTVYERQGVAAGIHLKLQGVPGFERQVAELRAWRRQRIGAILRPAAERDELALPFNQAVALVFVTTSHATWSSLVNESRLSPTAAKQVTTQALERALL